MKHSVSNLIILVILLGFCNSIIPQTVKNVVPDSCNQNSVFYITINGSGTEWHYSTYFEIYFDSVGLTGSNIIIINDTTLTAIVSVDPKAAVGWRQIIAADNFLNNYIKDSALYVRLSVPPAPLLISPINNSQNQLQNPSLLWDSNGYVTYFKIQVALDSLFTIKKIDTTVANPPYNVRPNFLTLGTKYFWRVNATNIKGTSPWSPVWNFRVRSTDIHKISEEIPTAYKLFNNYPNPFNPETNIRFQIPALTHVKIEIYDISGKRIETLIDSKIPSGIYSLKWNANLNPSGIYFCRFKTDLYTETKRLILLK